MELEELYQIGWVRLGRYSSFCPTCGHIREINVFCPNTFHLMRSDCWRNSAPWAEQFGHAEMNECGWIEENSMHRHSMQREADIDYHKNGPRPAFAGAGSWLSFPVQDLEINPDLKVRT